MGYDNFWLYIIELDEVIDGLYKAYAPLFKDQWENDIDLERDIINYRKKFFINNKKYLKYENSVNIMFYTKLVGDNNPYSNKSYFIITKIVIEKVI